jgi:hypothetical protein
MVDGSDILAANVRPTDMVFIIRGNGTTVPSVAIWDPNTLTERIGVHKTLAQAIADGCEVVGGVIMDP